jgi:3-methylcrotonyl-CoA carboxylase alpha subunit
MRLIARYDGVDIEVQVERHGSGYRVQLGDRTLLADLVDAGPSLRSLRLEDGTQFSFTHHRDGSAHQVTLADSTFHVDVTDPLSLKRAKREDEAAAGGAIKALMPGRIVRVLVAKGDTVRKGAGVLILEAMKMENEIHAPADGVVDELFVSAGQTVEAGADLLHVAPAPPL